MLYTQYETSKLMLQPLSHYLTRSLAVIEAVDKVFPQMGMFTNFHQAKYALTNNLIKDYPKMPWDLESIVDESGVSHPVQEQIIITKKFCEFKLFSLDGVAGRPAIFMVAPLSGHYATLLKDTVQTFLKDYDVYITDWLNCRDIPEEDGDFSFQDYVEYVIEFSKYIKDKDSTVNVLAVCQPTVPVAVAASYLAKFEPNYQFDKVILMGGPLDTRVSPTKVNEYAFNNSLDWFERNVIKSVPMYFKGHGRKVYPGFLQHMGFLSMNMKRHTQAHIDFFNHLVEGANLNAQKHQEFYDEYNAVMDLPATYYLETLEHVFIDQSLAKDKMKVFGHKISMSDIHRGNYLLLEGELDDISGAGQTHAAYNLLRGLDENYKNKVIAKGVGHYGIFSGSGFRNNVYPVLSNFLASQDLDTNVEEKITKDESILNIHKTAIAPVVDSIDVEKTIVDKSQIQDLDTLKTTVSETKLSKAGQEKLVEILTTEQKPTPAMEALRKESRLKRFPSPSDTEKPIAAEIPLVEKVGLEVSVENQLDSNVEIKVEGVKTESATKVTEKPVEAKPKSSKESNYGKTKRNALVKIVEQGGNKPVGK